MRLLALKALPNGIPAGATFTENEIVGRLLIQAGAAQVADAKAPPRLIKRRPRAASNDAD